VIHQDSFFIDDLNVFSFWFIFFFVCDDFCLQYKTLTKLSALFYKTPVEESYSQHSAL